MFLKSHSDICLKSSFRNLQSSVVRLYKFQDFPFFFDSWFLIYRSFWEEVGFYSLYNPVGSIRFQIPQVMVIWTGHSFTRSLRTSTLFFCDTSVSFNIFLYLFLFMYPLILFEHTNIVNKQWRKKRKMYSFSDFLHTQIYDQNNIKTKFS